MKKISIILSAFLLTISIQAQSIESFLEKLDDNDEYGVITINKEMFKMMASFDVDLGEDEQAIKTLINDINRVRVFINDETGTYEEYKEIKGIANNASMENLISFKEKGERVDLFTNPTSQDGVVDGLLLIVREETQNVFVHMDGKINLNDLSKLVEKLDIDGLDHLKKINRGN